MRIELATIPPYIYALYSLKDQKCFSAMLLKSIAAEEMLHAGLVANLLVGNRCAQLCVSPKSDFDSNGRPAHVFL